MFLFYFSVDSSIYREEIVADRAFTLTYESTSMSHVTVVLNIHNDSLFHAEKEIRKR